MSALYDTIGTNYTGKRRQDPRIAGVIHDALGGSKSVLNIGAGAGAYEPVSRRVIALEPSAEMIRQRLQDAAPVVQGQAEAIPFADDTFDAAMAVLTVHHWSDVEVGLGEMRRVTSGSLVIVTFDPAGPYFWLADYLPDIVALDQPIMPPLPLFTTLFEGATVTPVPVPHDCIDGFLGAYWRRPQAYLDPEVRAAISTFRKLGDISGPLAQLRHDLASGAWETRYGYLLDQDTLDIGYRLVVVGA